MKAVLLVISFFLITFGVAQDMSDTASRTLIFTDTEYVSVDEEGRHYKMNNSNNQWEPVAEEETFFEEYYMVMVFIVLLALYALYHFLKNKDKKDEIAAEETFTSKYFGEINKENPEEFYEARVDFYEREIDLIVNVVSENKIDHGNIERIEDYIDHLVINESKVSRAIQEDYKQNGEVKNYIKRCLEEIIGKDLVAPAKLKYENADKEEELLSSLQLIRINFYPEKQDKMFAILDYGIDEVLSGDPLIVMILKNNKMDIPMKHQD
jgi:hypothetical protein